MLRKVHLYGHLAQKYGAVHTFDISSASESVRALACNFPGFVEEFSKGRWHVLVGDNDNEAKQIDQKLLNFRLGHYKHVHLLPETYGSKGGGLKIIVGLALLAIPGFNILSAFAAGAGEFFTAGEIIGTTLGASAFSIGGLSVSFGAIASIGVSLIVGGISQAITKAPTVSNYGGIKSFIFSGALNRTAQGSAIPLVYGIFISGSVVGSASIQVEQLL